MLQEATNCYIVHYRSRVCSATVCATQAIRLKKILVELHVRQQEPILIYCGNGLVIKLSKNTVLHGRSKHIDVKFHFLRDLMKEKVIDVVYCRSEDQVADIFTKSLKLTTFRKLRKLLGVCTLRESYCENVIKLHTFINLWEGLLDILIK